MFRDFLRKSAVRCAAWVRMPFGKIATPLLLVYILSIYIRVYILSIYIRIYILEYIYSSIYIRNIGDDKNFTFHTTWKKCHLRECPPGFFWEDALTSYDTMSLPSHKSQLWKNCHPYFSRKTFFRKTFCNTACIGIPIRIRCRELEISENNSFRLVNPSFQ